MLKLYRIFVDRRRKI